MEIDRKILQHLKSLGSFPLLSASGFHEGSVPPHNLMTQGNAIVSLYSLIAPPRGPENSGSRRQLLSLIAPRSRIGRATPTSSTHLLWIPFCVCEFLFIGHLSLHLKYFNLVYIITHYDILMHTHMHTLIPCSLLFLCSSCLPPASSSSSYVARLCFHVTCHRGICTSPLPQHYPMITVWNHQHMNRWRECGLHAQQNQVQA